MSRSSNFDKLCHKLFSARADGTDFLSRKCDVKCRNCGNELRTYYCEERLLLVECKTCEVRALTEAQSPAAAAAKVLGCEVETNG